LNFLAEYASIIFMRLLFCIIFLGSDLYSASIYLFICVDAVSLLKTERLKLSKQFKNL
jgi:hypothetical protein